MKNFIVTILLVLPALSQDAPTTLEIPENSIIAKYLAREAGTAPLKDGAKIVIKITPPSTKSKAPAPNPVKGNGATLSLLNYQGKKGAPSTIAQAATRSGDTPDIKIVVLSPSNEAFSNLPQPRLWWHQSSASEGGELEFILTKITDLEEIEVFRRRIPPMKKGYNVIDLSHPAVNPEMIKLEAGHRYQWTINQREGSKANPAYTQLRYLEDEIIRNSLRSPSGRKKAPASNEIIELLSKSGNWYEVLDLVATPAKLNPSGSGFAKTQQRILTEAGLLKTINDAE